ncbi:MAG: hypothetical protein HQ551_01235 [Desulfobacteraceae bacterium]|nr:hypothetical protein [Desulfobacteraceae bacterium]
MLRKSFLSLFVLILIPSISPAETIDVQIKGFDDGIKTTKQQDYKEASLFAKREAIERAGVKIESITRVKDLVLMEDYIEAKAAAVLMPGYKIIDIGYNEVGTYVIVLIGRIKTDLRDSNVIMTQNWYIQKENLKFIQDKVECLEDGFKLIQVYDEKTHRIGKWKFYTKLKFHRSLFESNHASLEYFLIYVLRDNDSDIITRIGKDLALDLMLLTSDDSLFKHDKGPYIIMEVEGKGEIRAEDIERVRTRKVVIYKTKQD